MWRLAIPNQILIISMHIPNLVKIAEVSRADIPVRNWWNLRISNPKKGKRKVQGVPQSQTAALPRPQEEEVTDKSKHAQTEQTYEKH